MRQCEVCACSIEHLHPAKMTCSDACRREKKRRYDAIYDKNRPHVLQPIVKTKSCPSCCKRGERLPASAFQRNRSSCDGLQPYCKACRAKYDSRADQKMKNAKRKHEWYVRNADRLNRRQKARYWSDPALRERNKAYMSSRYYADHEATKASARRRYREKREAELAQANGVARICSCGKEFKVPSARDLTWFCSEACRRAAQWEVIELLRGKAA